jgi:hypothetical protein
MNNRQLAWGGARNALGAAFYVVLVVCLMSYAGDRFDSAPEMLTGIAVLMLFVTSALIEATLVLGQPIWMFVNGKKSEALRLFGYTAGALVALMMLAMTARIMASA